MRKTPTLALLCFLAADAGAFNFSSSARGTTAAEFLQLGVGARAVSMGEAYSAVADEASALYWNPAALTRTRSQSATFMHAAYIDSSFFDYGAYSRNLGGRGALGAGLQYFSAGNIAQTDTTGTDVGSFTPYDLAFTLGYAYRLDAAGPRALRGVSLGLGAKFIQSKVLHATETGAVDLGVLSPAYFGDRLRLAFTAANLGGTLQYDQVKENLPLALRFGGSYTILDRWQAALDLGLPKNDNPFMALGTEYWLLDGGAWKFAGRAGFNSQTIGSIDGFTGISFGVGIGYNGIAMDYGFVPLGGLGQAHRVSITYNF